MKQNKILKKLSYFIVKKEKRGLFIQFFHVFTQLIYYYLYVQNNYKKGENTPCRDS